MKPFMKSKHNKANVTGDPSMFASLAPANICSRKSFSAARTIDRSIARSVDCIAFFADAAAHSPSRIDCRLINQKCTHDIDIHDDDDKQKRQRDYD